MEILSLVFLIVAMAIMGYAEHRQRKYIEKQLTRRIDTVEKLALGILRTLTPEQLRKGFKGCEVFDATGIPWDVSNVPDWTEMFKDCKVPEELLNNYGYLNLMAKSLTFTTGMFD